MAWERPATAPAAWRQSGIFNFIQAGCRLFLIEEALAIKGARGAHEGFQPACAQACADV
jgi:hypothetical protein